MSLRPTHLDESRCHPEPFAVTRSEAKGLQYLVENKQMQILRSAQDDSPIGFFRGPARELAGGRWQGQVEIPRRARNDMG